MPVPLCKHCKEKEASQARGLCSICYSKHRIRNLYPRMYRSWESARREMTEREVEELIAEQSKPENLPAWWDRDTRAMRELAEAGKIPSRSGL